MTDPRALFIDEATTGLDSASAKDVIDFLQGVASRGLAVVCVVHQPNFELLQQFQKLLILAQGQAVYFGPVANSVSYFAGLGYACPQYCNPSDYFLDILQSSGETDFGQRWREHSQSLSGASVTGAVPDLEVSFPVGPLTRRFPALLPAYGNVLVLGGVGPLVRVTESAHHLREHPIPKFKDPR